MACLNVREPSFNFPPFKEEKERATLYCYSLSVMLLKRFSISRKERYICGSLVVLSIKGEPY